MQGKEELVNKSTKAFILAGGRGTRFHPFSFTIPKPLMPIGEEPILLRLINRFKSEGITEFVISLGYHSELIKAYFGDGARFGVSIRYVKEDIPLGTAGPLSLIRDEVAKDEYVFLINGDIYTEMSFQKMLQAAQASGIELLVGYVQKTEKSSFGILNIENNAITSVTEKPERTFAISSGIYLVRGAAIENIPVGKFFTAPDLMNIYMSSGRKVGAYRIDDFWMGIENVENLDEVMKRVNATASKGRS